MKPYSVFIKGQPVTPASSRLAKTTGFSSLVSRANGDLPAKCRDATRFLQTHAADFAVLNSVLNAGQVWFDFGLWDISSESRPWPSFFLPHRLVALAGGVGVALKLSFYGPPGGE